MEAGSLMLVPAARWEVVTRQCRVSGLPSFHCVSRLSSPPRCSLAWPQLCLSVRLSVQTRRHVARLSAFTSAVVQVGGKTQLQFCSVSQINPSIHWERCNETTWQLQCWFMLLIYVKWIESVQAFCLLIEIYIFLRLVKPLKKTFQNYILHLLTVLCQQWLSHCFSSNLQLPSISHRAVLCCISQAQQVHTIYI